MHNKYPGVETIMKDERAIIQCNHRNKYKARSTKIITEDRYFVIILH